MSSGAIIILLVCFAVMVIVVVSIIVKVNKVRDDPDRPKVGDTRVRVGERLSTDHAYVMDKTLPWFATLEEFEETRYYDRWKRIQTIYGVDEQDVVNKMNMKEVVIVYGQTEASPGCTMSCTDDSVETRVATVGRPLPEIECRIIDPETGLELPDEATGEFVARGYNIMKGYYKMPEATAAAIDSDGWLHTGDLACRTPDGNYRITGRLKDMIIRGGENIYPKELEEFLYSHPKVKDVQVIGVPDEELGEEIVACIIMKENESATEEEIKAFFRANMARHKCPRYIDFTDEFPMNVAGKILKYKMREQAIEKFHLQKAASIKTA